MTQWRFLTGEVEWVDIPKPVYLVGYVRRRWWEIWRPRWTFERWEV